MDICKNRELPTKADNTFVWKVKLLRFKRWLKSQKGKTGNLAQPHVIFNSGEQPMIQIYEN